MAPQLWKLAVWPSTCFLVFLTYAGVAWTPCGTGNSTQLSVSCVQGVCAEFFRAPQLALAVPSFAGVPTASRSRSASSAFCSLAMPSIAS